MNFIEVGTWFWNREKRERPEQYADIVVPSDIEGMVQLFQSRGSGKYHSWFPKVDWRQGTLTRDEFERLMVVDSEPVTRQEGLVVEGTPRTLINAARFALGNGYFDLHFRQQLPLGNSAEERVRRSLSGRNVLVLSS